VILYNRGIEDCRVLLNIDVNAHLSVYVQYVSVINKLTMFIPHVR